jgi:hypothetical protein
MAAYLPRRATRAFRRGQNPAVRLGLLGDSAPTADVCDKGVFWTSPLRPRTMLSLKKAAILSRATRPGY